VSLSRIRELYQRQISEYKGKGYIASGYVEGEFVRALQSYLTFAREFLRLPLPLLIEAGFIGIKGYSITVDANSVRGQLLDNHVAWRGEVTSFDAPAYELIGPFFDFVWKRCGVQRPASRQAELAEQFEGKG